MKATIKRVIEAGELPRFQIYSGDKFIRSFFYKDGVPEDDLYNEERNLQEAKKLAAIIEKSPEGTIEEIVYETPETEQSTNQ